MQRTEREHRPYRVWFGTVPSIPQSLPATARHARCDKPAKTIGPVPDQIARLRDVIATRLRELNGMREFGQGARTYETLWRKLNHI